MDQLPRLGKRELICLLLFTCNYVVSVWRGFLFLWVLGMGYVILLCHSLSLPYNYFQIFPDIWKDALVCPIPKGGNAASVSNYRPKSLLSCLGKVPERVIFKYLYNHFRDNDILSPLQSGFIPGDSTTNQLTFLYNTFCKALDSDKEKYALSSAMSARHLTVSGTKAFSVN